MKCAFCDPYSSSVTAEQDQLGSISCLSVCDAGGLWYGSERQSPCAAAAAAVVDKNRWRL